MKAQKRGLIPVFGIMLAVAGIVPAQPIVATGTGNPDGDVPAVQAAVDQGGRIALIGHFSFDRAPTIPAARPTAAWSP
jgi:hypothetical protein